MDNSLPEYIEEPIRDELSKVVATVTANLPENLEETFVSTSFSQGERNYPSVWLFTSKLAVEIRYPLRQARIQYEMFRLKNSVDWIRLNARRYDFGDPAENSELDIEFTTIDSVSSILEATGDGCRHLMGVYKRWFSPNFTGTRELD